MAERLRRLHLGLTIHVAEDGSEVARLALERHVSDTQQSFERALQAVRDMVGGRADATRPLPPMLVRFGHLGSTKADERTVDAFRRHRAARTIQRRAALAAASLPRGMCSPARHTTCRHVRQLLARRDRERRLEAARRLRLFHCARRVQRCYRAFRRREQSRRQLVESLRQRAAATKIQRWYRGRVRARAAHRRALEAGMAQQARQAAVYREELAARVECAEAGSRTDPAHTKAAVTIQRYARRAPGRSQHPMPHVGCVPNPRGPVQGAAGSGGAAAPRGGRRDRPALRKGLALQAPEAAGMGRGLP